MKVTLVHLVIGADEPFAISGRAVGGVDRPVELDPYGAVYVPTTSVAGSLREHLRGLGLDIALMGSSCAEGDLEPSRLRLVGTRCTIDGHRIEASDLSQRQVTAVDRHLGAGRGGSLRTEQLVPAGARIDVYVRVDGNLTDDELAAISSWAPWLGGRRTAGAGRASLRQLRTGVLDLTVTADLERWLRLEGPDLWHEVAIDRHQVTAPTVAAVVDCELELVDGLHQAGASDGNLRATYRRLPDGPPVIEGSSLKGLLRSGAELILRSLGEPACAAGVGHDGDAACTCKACVLFGTRDRRGLVRVLPAEVHDAHVIEQPHVSIDRITGGAAPGRLFTDEVVQRGRFRLVVEPLTKDLPRWAAPLLWWIVADLHEGHVGVGGLTTRGLGTVRLTDPAPLERLEPLQEVLADG